MQLISNLQSPLTTPAAWEWLQQTQSGRVLHVFERACNLVNERAEVLSLVARPVGLGPFGMVVEGVEHPAGFLQWLDGASAVGVEGTRLLVGRLVVETGRASLWQPRPDWATVQKGAGKVAGFLPLLRSLLAAEAPAGSLAVLGDLPNHPTTEESASSDAEQASEDALLLQVREGANQLHQGIEALDLGFVQSAAHQLAGLGGGLTPAGDDFLLGAMVALWATRPEEVVRSLVEAIVAAALPRTTRLSAAYLAAAGRGEVSLLWHKLLAAIAAAEEGGVKAAGRAILRTGHSSGADMLAGFCLMVEA
jgi:hypothetical protein